MMQIKEKCPETAATVRDISEKHLHSHDTSFGGNSQDAELKKTARALWHHVPSELILAAYEVRALMHEETSGFSATPELLWGLTAAVMYRAGRLSMYRDCRQLRLRRKHR